MRRLRLRPGVARDERGASLILAITFMLVIGGISGAVISSVRSGLSARHVLDTNRNREYAADGGIEQAITQVRQQTTSPGIGFVNPCSPAGGFPPWSLNGVGIRVDCQNAPTLTQNGFLQRNVIFNACLSGAACNAKNTIVRAQINFEAITLPNGSLLVSKTTVQSWSVNQ